MRALPTIAAITLWAACTDPRFDVRINGLDAIGDPRDSGQVLRTQVSVIDAVAAATTSDLGAQVSCLDVAHNRIDPAVLDGARRASASGDDGAPITGVPRLGPKLVIVEVRNAAGRRFGAGCTEIGDISDDEVVPVDLVVAPSVQVFVGQETTDIVTMSLLTVKPWAQLETVSGHRVVAEVHTSGDTYSGPIDVIGDDGRYDTPVLPPAGTEVAAGPAQTVVRVEWAEELIRVPAFVPWQAIQTAETSPGVRPRITLAPDATPGFTRNWTLPPVLLAGLQYNIIAAAVEQPAAGSERVVVLRYDRGDTRTIDTITVPAPGVRSVAFFPVDDAAGLVTVLEDGWVRINANAALVPVAGTAEGTGAASQVHAVVDCDGGGEQTSGLLVRRLIGGVETYRAYAGAGEPASPGSDLFVVAADLAPGEVVVGSDCLTLDDGMANGRPVQVVLSRGGGVGLTARIVDDNQPAVLPDVLAVTTYEQANGDNQRRRAAGVVATVEGPRVLSYKLGVFPTLDDQLEIGFVDDGRVDSQLATVPVSFDLVDFDGDFNTDVVAAVPTPLGPRLQVNLGRLVDGEPLASVTDPLPGGRRATNALVRLVDVDGVGRRELVVLTDEGVDVFCLGTETPTTGARCAALPD